MTSFKNYFFYHFKNTFLRLIVLCVFSLLLIATNMSYYDKYYSPAVFGYLLGILCTLVPILELSGFKKRRNLDSLFSLPVSRKKQALIHYLNGLMHITTVYTTCFIVMFIYLAVKNNRDASGYFVAYYLLSLAMASFIYSVFMFVFNQANTIVDGVIFEILAAYSLFWLVQAIRVVFGLEVSGPLYTIYSPFGNDGLFQLVRDELPFIPWKSLVMCITWVLIGIACMFGYLYTFEKTRVENVGGISNALFGYKLYIPLWASTLLVLGGSFLFIFIYVSMFIGYIIYRRGVKLTMIDYISIVSTIPFLAIGMT